MITDAQMRELALALPDTQEKSHFGHPDFRVNNRIFATLWLGQQRAVLRLAPEDQAAAILSNAEIFKIPSGSGRGGWTSVDLVKVDEEEFRKLVHKAWVALPRPRPRKEVARRRADGQ